MFQWDRRRVSALAQNCGRLPWDNIAGDENLVAFMTFQTHTYTVYIPPTPTLDAANVWL
jgi:hypothetical protein